MEQVGPSAYRAFVGPPGQFDLMGATQFSLLCALGLREGHRLLDIGCGSLRAGRLLIPYLARGGYTGLEPNQWLVEQVLEHELGHDLVELKRATFVHNDGFDVSGLEPFNFVVAQSIASHTGPTMTRELLAAVREALAPSGLAAVTFIHDRCDQTEEGWVYPGVVTYRRRTIARWLHDAGLDGVPLRWYHPRQTWWAIVHQGARLPPRQLRFQARGAVLPFQPSWNRAARAVQTFVRRLPRPLRHALVRRRIGRDSGPVR